MRGTGGVEVLYLGEHPDPVMGDDELLVRIKATALNRADLLHAGGSGVGAAAVQLVREAGAVSLVTAGSREKIDRCLALGARAGWNYKEGAFAPWVAQTTGGEGRNIVLDFVGAPYFEQNLQALAVDGRVVVIGPMGGAEV